MGHNILSPNSGHQATTATIKTDSGIQSVPIIIQQPTSAIIQQPAPTQYILATNQQGQTYVVAQQPIATPQIPQTVLLAQTPGQQGQKTIIILQQPQGQHSGQTIQVAQPQQQKIIMTPSGQQVIYSSPVQRQVQQVIQPTPPPQASIIQNSATPQAANRKIVITNTVDSTGKVVQQTQQTPTKIVQASSQQTIQAIAQGQNIIMQKGQKYQIGSTQITQIVSPTPKSASPKLEVPPVTTAASTVIIKEAKVAENSPAIAQVPAESPSESEVKIEENETNAAKLPNESPNTEKTSQNSSGSSSPAPSNKQTISIQIPVPQSQIAGPNAQQYTIKIVPSMDPSVKVKDEDVEPSWPFVCEVRISKIFFFLFLNFNFSFLVERMSEEEVQQRK